MLKKIVVIGPESTGKSTLCGQLAQYYGGTICAEFAREYLLRHGKEYSFEDLLTIAKGQLLLEDETALIAGPASTKDKRYPPLLFIDTDMYVMKVWCEYVFGKCHHFILEEIVKRKYDLYLLCNTDLPWIKDELREYPDEGPRKELYRIYKDLLINQEVPWIEIGGQQEERLRTAVTAVDKMINL